jgi:hypothetical protein
MYKVSPLNTDQDAEASTLGYIVSLVVASIATVCCIVLKIGYDRANKQRDALSKEAIEEQWSEKDM